MCILSKMRINDDRFFKVLQVFQSLSFNGSCFNEAKKQVHKPDFWNPYKEKRQKHLIGKEMVKG